VARNETVIRARPEEVWAVLADPDSYGDWVVGSHEVRFVEGDWPEPGATFHHTQGHPPLTAKDTTSVIEADAPRHLVLEVRIRPWSVGTVELDLHEAPEGTRVVMHERISSGLVGRLSVGGRLVDPLVCLRNVESLRRLRRLAEGGAWAGVPVRRSPRPGSPRRATR
jgi:uncharacterized protein YndB with AHSA1/START domain